MTVTPPPGDSADSTRLAAQLEAARAECAQLRQELAEVSYSVVRWRAAALSGWNVRGSSAESGQVQRELEAMRDTLSWRVTKPLRVVRTMLPTRRG
jgi:uncharacterized membrane-anchored protein